MIERLYVHNFRCLENFTLELAGRSSALVIGKNGAGKSTVLECLKLFQSVCRGPIALAIASRQAISLSSVPITPCGLNWN